MSSQDRFEKLVKDMGDITNELADEVAELRAQSSRTDLTAVEEEAVAARWDALNATLKAIGANPADPIPAAATRKK